MKCLILAAGKGNSMWPLSRKSYPKQFLNIKDNRSLFQETIARNIPFCEEFLITANSNYNSIIANQMKAFQGLKYRCFFEEEVKRPGALVTMICMMMNPSEIIFVLSSDQIVDSNDYKDTIIGAVAKAREGNIVAFGMDPKEPYSSHGFMRCEGDRVIEFLHKSDAAVSKEYALRKDTLWNTGNYIFCAGDYLQAVKNTVPEFYNSCKKAVRGLSYSKRIIDLSRNRMSSLESVGVASEIINGWDKVLMVKSPFEWKDVGNLEILSEYIKNVDRVNIIEQDCRNVTIINKPDHKLVVANGIEDAMIINTEDAIYIAKKGGGKDIKSIIKENEAYAEFFEQQPEHFYDWGSKEILKYEGFYRIKKVIIYPGGKIKRHKHAKRSEQWTVVKGSVSVILGNEEREYSEKESVYVPKGVAHSVENISDEDSVIIEIAIGEELGDSDITTAVSDDNSRFEDPTDIIKLEPAFKDYLWGGTKLKDIYNKKCDYDIVAESWELSSHADGQSIVAEGKYKGLPFGEYLARTGKRALGWKCQALDRFPILIKFIDAKQSLSIQVHPDDDFGLRTENEFGKNEMWHIVDCDKDAFIYYGVKKNITKEELEKRIENNTILEVLNKVEVKKGDTFFVEAGTIHAIGAGILICEIQQNSNCTYRIYDYDRRDKYGNARELHIAKAREVCNLRVMSSVSSEDTVETFEGYTVEVLGSCKYFESVKYEIETRAEFETDEASFVSVIILDGSGTIGVGEMQYNFNAADSFFIPAGKKKVTIEGNCSLIKTHV